MKDVLDAVAMHKADIHDICEQMKVATPSGVESLSGRLRAAVVMLENELAALFERKAKPDTNAAQAESEPVKAVPAIAAAETGNAQPGGVQNGLTEAAPVPNPT